MIKPNAPINLLEAINQALYDTLEADERVMLLGEDIARCGGVFRATQGLAQQFPGRVLDTPLTENLLSGLAVGLAAQGMRPVIEFQFSGFIYPGMDAIVNHATRLAQRTQGRLNCPIVYRAPYGAGIHAPEHHSESPEALFTHIPGIKVLMPASPNQAYGLLRAAINDPEPVLFLEPKRLYRAVQEPFKPQHYPLGKSYIRREGKDITLIAWGSMLEPCFEAAASLEPLGIACTILDVSTLKPLNQSTLIQAVKTTGRAIIVHEAPLTSGFGAELAALIQEHAWHILKAPVQRITGRDTMVPPFQLEQHYLPSAETIVQKAQELMAWT